MSKMLPLLFVVALLGGCSMLPGRDREVSQSTRPAHTAYNPTPDERQCLSRLDQTQANFTPLPDQSYGAGCGMRNTVRLSALHSDYSTLSLSNLGPVTCPLATTFAGWARYGVDRAARAVLGSPLARIETMGSYNCRNVAGSGKRSAHATANAVDVSAFILEDGRRISVEQGWSNGTAAERQFLRIVHESACKRFGTVLGPGYNAAHHNHFHLESGDSSFCR